MNLSNKIAEEILNMLQSDGEATLQRNDLAQHLGCAPSQINYVISSRFTPEKGYLVESRRGGGGYILIRRIGLTGSNLLMHIVNSIGDEIDENTARVFISNAYEYDLIDESQARTMISAVNENNFKMLEPSVRGNVRAEILKRMLLTR